MCYIYLRIELSDIALRKHKKVNIINFISADKTFYDHFMVYTCITDILISIKLTAFS